MALSSRQIPISWDQTVPPSLPTAKKPGTRAARSAQVRGSNPAGQLLDPHSPKHVSLHRKVRGDGTERQDITAAARAVLPLCRCLTQLFKLSASCSRVPMGDGREGAAAYAGCYKGKVGPCHGAVLQRTKPHVARFQVPAGASHHVTASNPPAGEPSSAQLTGAQGCPKGRVVSLAESDAEDAAGKPSHGLGIPVHPLCGLRDHPRPDNYHTAGNKAWAKPCTHLPPATRSHRCCCTKVSREQEPSPSQTWQRGCLEISLACSKRCERKINLNNYCPQLAWPCPSSGFPWT